MNNRNKLGILLAALLSVVGLTLGGAVATADDTLAPPDLSVQWGTDPTTGQATLAWDAGECAGYFADIQKVNNILEWGAESHCSGTGWIPHHLEVTLQQKEDTPVFPDIFFESVAWANSNSAQFGHPDISIYLHSQQCVYGTSTTYRMTATITAGSHTASGLSDEFTIPCKIWDV